MESVFKSGKDDDSYYTKIYSRLGLNDYQRVDILQRVLLSPSNVLSKLQTFLSEILFDEPNVPAFVYLSGLQLEFTANYQTAY